MSLTKGFRILHQFEPQYSALVEWRGANENGLVFKNGTIVEVDRDVKDGMKSNYTKALDGYGCAGVLKFATSSGFEDKILVIITNVMSVGKVFNSEIFKVTGVSFLSLQNGNIDNDSRCSDIKRLLASGKFYFAWTSSGKDVFDLTSNFQSKSQGVNRKYFWNQLMHLDFKHFGVSTDDWLFTLISGGIDIKTIYIASQQAKAVIISRLSCERAGTRYNVRGIDDNGNVANFVESEQIIIIGNKVSSFMQIRGSVPLFWEQPGLNVGSHKVRMARGFEASAPAFERHLGSLIQNYGKTCILNLLGHKEGESNLSRAFQSHHSLSPRKAEIQMFCFDYHAECKGKSSNVSKLEKKIKHIVEDYGIYTFNETDTICQSGVLRVNCLDCLDRTNSVQTYFGMAAIKKQLESLGINDTKLEDRFREAFKNIWPETGDLISRMYAGTGALEGKVKLKDGARSMTRAIQNNFLDQNKQHAVDIMTKGIPLSAELLFRSKILFPSPYLCLAPNLLDDLLKMHTEYTVPVEMNIFVGTWNVNGGKHYRSIAYKHEKLEDWLLDGPKLKYNSSSEDYCALYDYQSDEPGDLCFNAGDVIKVSEELEEGQWLKGILNDQEGIFPTAYAQKMLPQYVALFDFPCQQEGDLGFNKGDYIEVSKSAGEWWEGKVVSDDMTNSAAGIFPASFVKKVSENNNTDDTDNIESNTDWNKPIDIFAIGFEEMVELSAGNIVNTSNSNQQAWGIELQKTISRDYKYIQVASDQLVGVCLYIFTRPQHAPHVQEVEICSVKTGMGGAAGNKGAIGVSLKFYNSSVVFVCSHLAAGQSQIQERNNDFSEICKKMIFTGNRNLFHHDYVFWCGDLNYRIDMSNDEVKSCVALEEWHTLQEFDQLNNQREEGNTFQQFEEGDITFAPTYKYDLFSDDYDTSEKFRTPAWTDRVLWYTKENIAKAKLLYYGRAELKTSDHRPVNAILSIDVLQTDEEHLKNSLNKVMYDNGPLDASVVVYYHGDLQDACDEIITKLTFYGDVKAHFVFADCVLVTYGKGNEALKALNCSGQLVNGQPITVELKSPEWSASIEREIQNNSVIEVVVNDDKYMLDANGQQDLSKFDYDQESEDIDDNSSQQYSESDAFDEQSDAGRYATDDVMYTDNNLVVENDTKYDANDYVAPAYANEQYNSAPTSASNDYNSEISSNHQTEEQFESYDHSDPGWACEDIYNNMPVQTTDPKSLPPKPAPPTSFKKKPPAPPRPKVSPATTPTEPVSKKPPPRPSSTPSIKVGPPEFIPSPKKLPPPILPSKPPVAQPVPMSPPVPAERKPKRRAPGPPPGKKNPPALPRVPPKAAPVLQQAWQSNINPAFDDLSIFDAPLPTNANNLIDAPLGLHHAFSDPLIPLQPTSGPNNLPQSSLTTSKKPADLFFDSLLDPLAPTIAPTSSNPSFPTQTPPIIPLRSMGLPPKPTMRQKPMVPQKASQNDPWSIGGESISFNNSVPNSFSSDFSKFGFKS